jgi:hypothetical protein
VDSGELTGHDAPSDGGTRWFRERLAALAGAEGERPRRAAVLESPPLREGHMPPLYARDGEESFYVLEGEAVFHVGDEVVRARAGAVVVAPAGVPRTYIVTSRTARWLVMSEVASLARYEDFTRAVTTSPAGAVPGRPAWPSPEERAALTAIARANGIAILGPPGALPCDLAA